ncbi:MAG: glycosyltransferase family 4 protein [Chitinophagaceae bacterium]
MKKKTAIFLMPRSSRAWNGAEALWITVAGWAAAAEQLWGSSWVATTDTVVKAADVIHYPIKDSKNDNNVVKPKGKYGWMPHILRNLLKDLQLKRMQPSVWAIEKVNEWKNEDVQLVWEQHDLYPGVGYKLSRQLRVPFVVYVHGPVVWEMRKWGVKRPLWGKWLEKNVEAVSLKRADLIACVTDEVRNKVIEMGIDESKVIVSPMSVDTSLFYPNKDAFVLKKKLNIEDKFVIGWTGSFRTFHGLDTVVKAFAKLQQKTDNVVLMLVGDGFERQNLKKLVQDLSLATKVIFTGKLPFTSIPDYVACFDVAIVSAKSAEGFHYSPLKLREYMATAKATIAPRAGDLPKEFNEGEHLLFYEAGSEDDLLKQLEVIVQDDSLRLKLGKNALDYVLQSSTWAHELKRVVNLLNLNAVKRDLI